MFHISRDFNKARSPKGFHMTFENGYTLSVQFGMGNYCSNRHEPLNESVLETIEKYVGPEECKDAETAIWDVNGDFLKYKGEDVVKIKKGKFNCLKFAPVLQEGRIWENEEDLTVWITNDQNKIPLLAKTKILVGSIKMELCEYEGLAGPISKI